MYLWIGAKLPEDFEACSRQICIPVSQALGLDISGFSLPQHISLKISFDAGNQAEAILNFLDERFRKEHPFYVNPQTPQRQGNILWMPFRPNAPLHHLHNMLDRELKLRFGIPQHPFDQAFFFHSTLFLGEEAPLCQAEEILKEMPLPVSLKIDTICIGISETGKSGDYHVVREIKLKPRQYQPPENAN